MGALKNYVYIMPILTLIGKGCLNDLGSNLKNYGVKKALIVTDTFMCKSGVSSKISEILKAQGIESAVYDGVKANPTIRVVNEGINSFLENECDSLISLGGGSAHDSAKAVRISLMQGGLSKLSRIVLAAVNTTAGTASEMTKYCIITDEEQHRKLAIVNVSAVPDIAVDDPELMVGMPQSLTAATGMDALTHAVEAFTAKGNNELTDCTALRAIELIFENLAVCCSDGNNMESREKMAYAQFMAGMAFSNAGLGLVHAMAHQLGGVYNLPHGVCNAVLLPHVMEYNMDVNYNRYSIIAKKSGVSVQGMPDKISARRLIQEIRSLSTKIGIPANLKLLNVNPDDFDKLSEMAMQDATYQANAKIAPKEDLMRIFKNAYL